MSKASEFAETMATTSRPKFATDFPTFSMSAEVTDQGDVRINGVFPKREAIALARWLLETFDEVWQALPER